MKDSSDYKSSKKKQIETLAQHRIRNMIHQAERW